MFCFLCTKVPPVFGDLGGLCPDTPSPPLFFDASWRIRQLCMCLKSSGATQTAGRQDCRKTGHGKGAVINYTRKEVGKKHGNSKQKFKIPAASVCNMISLPHRKCSFGFIAHPYNLCHATSIVKLIAYLPTNTEENKLPTHAWTMYIPS